MIKVIHYIHGIKINSSLKTKNEVFMVKSNFELITNDSISSKQIGTKGVISVFDISKINGFNVKRVYTITGENKGSVRGHHAHRELKQVMFCNYGSIKIQLYDGLEWTDIILDQPSKFLFISSMLWRTMEWLEENSVLTVLASEEYDESDYIRNFDDFYRMVNR